MGTDTAPEAPLTRAEIVQAINNLCHRAKREMHVVGTAEYPTPWDRRHDAINERLSELEACAD